MLISKKEKSKVVNLAWLKPQVKNVPSHSLISALTKHIHRFETPTHFAQHVWDTVIKPQAAIWIWFMFKQCVNSIKRTMLISFWQSFVAEPALDASSSSFVVFGLIFFFLSCSKKGNSNMGFKNILCFRF